jgi:hypothetical protein
VLVSWATWRPSVPVEDLGAVQSGRLQGVVPAAAQPTSPPPTMLAGGTVYSLRQEGASSGSVLTSACIPEIPRPADGMSRREQVWGVGVH